VPTLPPGGRRPAPARRALSFALAASLLLVLAPTQRVTLAQKRGAIRPAAVRLTRQLPAKRSSVLKSAPVPSPAAFSSGNLVVYRVGTGSASLTNASTAVFLDEYTAAGVLVQSIAMPTADGGSNQTLTASGTATSEGLLTRSVDGQYLTVTGYDVAPGTASVAATTSATVNRVVGRVDAAGTVNTTTALTDAYNQDSIRSAVSTDGTNIWTSGTGNPSSSAGSRYTTLGATTTTQLSTSVTNLRQTNIFGGQLYVSSASGSFRLASVGTGTPTTSAQTITNLPGIPTSTISPYGFFFADLDAGVSGVDTLYIADDRTQANGGGILKYSLVGGTWTSNGTLASGSNLRGLTAVVSGASVTLYATGAGAIVTATDTSGYNATNNGTFSTVASAASNTAFRGVALAPVSAAPTLNIGDAAQAEGDSGTNAFSFNVSLSAPAPVGGVSFTVNTADGTTNPATGGTDYVTISGGSGSIDEGQTSTFVNVTVNGDADFEPDETFFVNISNITGASPGDVQGLGTINNDDASPVPTLTINDVSQEEGNAGTTAFTFTVSLSSSTHEGVTFNICSADGTAQDGSNVGEDNDYSPICFGSQSIANGDDSADYTVNVNGDTTVEPDETFFVNVTSITGATATAEQSQGQGIIVNDDFVITPINVIQGSTPTEDNNTDSPRLGQVQTTTGIVTLLKTGQNTGAGSTASGFFIQDPNPDSDPNTSEGIFVFTSSVPTYTTGGGNVPVAVGDEVRVTGTVAEFNGLTEITSVTYLAPIDTGNTLPTAVTLDSTILNPAAPAAQPNLEKYESMRLTGTLKTVAPNDGFYDAYTVLPAVPRQQVFREPGIPSGNPVPPDPTSGTPDCCIPVWDRNPEKLKVDTNGRAGAANVGYTSNVTFTDLSGPLDYAFGEYRLVAGAAPAASAPMTAVAVPEPDENEFTVASYNIENFNNNATQRQKAADTIRNLLHSPDIIGAVEIFDLADLQALRDEINSDAVANSEPNPQYEAYLVEADGGAGGDNDQDVGFLVKTSRVQVNGVTQEREEETFINPNTGQPQTLHDRPPFVLDATVDPTGANPQRVIVVVNHLRSFIDIELVSGEGVRVREKRKKQAESLADLLNDLQTANPGVPVISVGDYNAFEFNNGYDDPLSVIKGSPTADDQIVVDQSPDLVNPNLFNLTETLPAAERYSFFFDEGTEGPAMQALDHHVVNRAARRRNSRAAIARVNSDFPGAPAATYEDNAATPERNSDHDPVVSYYRLGAPQAAGSLIISEFRFRGPGGTGGGDDGGELGPASNAPDGGGPNAPGTVAENDEFVELYNNTDSEIIVSTLDGSRGWAVVAADGVARFIIPNETVIPARGHFLAVNEDGYSLTDYGVGDEVLLPADSSTHDGYTLNIPDGSGIALFNTAEPANFTLDNRLDAAGYATVDQLYREGAGFPATGAEATSDLEHSFVRRTCVFDTTGCSGPGRPRDTSDNTSDFVVVNTEAAETALGARLGAPGPEGLRSAINGNAGMPVDLLDPPAPTAQSPNRVRDNFIGSPATNNTFGTMSIRRTITNNTGAPVRYLAFRIIEITTAPAPAGTADLRALNSQDIPVEVDGNTVDVRGTVVEEPPDQPNGGGLNSSMTTGFINLENQLEDGDSVSVQFLLGIMQTGAFRFYLNIEMINDGLVPEGPVSMAARNLNKLRQEQRRRQRPRFGSR
jgi:predicted extracellular nuclease